MKFSSPLPHSALHDKLNKFRKMGKFCDLSIIVGAAQFKSSKAFIAASSEYFAEKLDEISSQLEVNQVSAQTFAEILDYLYSGNVALHPENFENMKAAARLFQLPWLLDFCDVYENVVASAISFPDVQLDLSSATNDESALLEETVAIKKTNPAPIIPLSKRVKRTGKPESKTPRRRMWRSESSTEILSDDNNNVDVIDEDIDQDPVTASNSGDMEPDCNEKRNHVSVVPHTEGVNANTPLSALAVDGAWLRDNASRRKLFACSTCKKSFSQFMTYKLHLLCHDESPIYKCFKCNFVDTSSKSIEDHMKTSHKDDVQPDDNADIDAEASTTVCVECNEEFENPVQFRNHVKEKHKKVKPSKVYPCRICKKVFHRHSHHTRHMISHSGERKHCCTTCGKLFLKSDHLKRHERTHTSERPFTCEKCGKGFRDKDHLKRHQYTHSEERPYFCEICGKQFKDKSTLLSHQKCHDPALLSCKTCGKGFKTEEKLDLHMEKHLPGGVKKHACDVCGKRFPVNSKLKLHMRSHTDAKPFHCETCGKQFRAFHCLRLHQKKHTGIGLLPCDECGKTFTNASHLRRHAKIHTGEKPFRCEVCKKSFARRDNLEAHRRLCQVQQQTKQTSSESGSLSSPSWDLGSNSRGPTMVTATMGQRSEIVSESLVPTVVPRLADQPSCSVSEKSFDDSHPLTSLPQLGKFFPMQSSGQVTALPSLVAGLPPGLNPAAHFRNTDIASSMLSLTFQTASHQLREEPPSLLSPSKQFEQHASRSSLDGSSPKPPSLRHDLQPNTAVHPYMEFDPRI